MRRMRYILPIIAILLGFLLMVYSANRIASRPGQNLTVSQIFWDELFRGLGVVFVGSAIIAMLVHWQLESAFLKEMEKLESAFLKEIEKLESAFLKEIEKKVMSAGLNDLLGEDIGSHIDGYILRQPFFYRDYKFEGVFQYDPTDNTKNILTAKISTSYIVRNKTAEKQDFTIYSFYTEIPAGCEMRDTKILISPAPPSAGQPITTITEDEIRNNATLQDGAYLFIKNISLLPHQEIKIKFFLEGSVNKKDRVVERLRYPTENMSLFLTFPPDIHVDGRFYHPANDNPEICEKDPAGSNPYHISIKGGILPYQAIEVFWEPKQRR